MPHSCLFPYYCPANSSAMKSCEGGSMPVNTSGLRGSKNSCCSVCEGGTYRPYLSPIPHCLSCLPGYFCPPGTLLTTINHPRYQCMCVVMIGKLWVKCDFIIIQQVQTTTRVSLALLGMFVPWGPPNQYHAPLAPSVILLMLRQWMTVIHVQRAPSTTCLLKRPAFPVAAPPPHQQVRSNQVLSLSLSFHCPTIIRSGLVEINPWFAQLDVKIYWLYTC